MKDVLTLQDKIKINDQKIAELEDKISNLENENEKLIEKNEELEYQNSVNEDEAEKYLDELIDIHGITKYYDTL